MTTDHIIQFENRRRGLPTPALGEHAVVTGTNGSGKTYTVCKIVLSSNASSYGAQWIIFDTKGDEAFEFLPAAIHTSPSSVLKDGDNAIVVYRPERENLEASNLDYVIDSLYSQHRLPGTFLYLDETYQVCPNSKPTPGFANAVMRGRRRWNGRSTSRLTFFTGSQRPVWIPRFCFTEAKHYYIHELSDDDTDIMSDYIGGRNHGRRLIEEPVEGHEFYYYYNGVEKERRYPPQKFEFQSPTEKAA